MALWMDMTNSLRAWQGGVVGIVRAELEIAKNIKAQNPDLRISVANEQYGFVEIEEDQLRWLWNADSVADAYMEAMGRNKKKTEEVKLSNATDEEVEIPGLSSAMAYSSSRLVRLKRAGQIIIVKSPKIVRPIEYAIGGVLYAPLKMGSVLRCNLKKLKQRAWKRSKIKVNANVPVLGRKFEHPYQEGDTVLSVGWYGTSKESSFSIVKSQISNLCLVYLVYDLVLIKKGTTQLFEGAWGFHQYFEWITNNCDYVLYGGKTAMMDSIQYQKENGLRVMPGDYVKFGADIKQNFQEMKIRDVLQKYKVDFPYVITVGSVDAKKNQQVLYKAYSIIADRGNLDKIPDLLIIGGKYACPNLVDAIETDPKIAGKIRIIQPNDDELDALYKNCLFTLLPSLYEGWSLTLPEALGYGKICLTSDVAPLREVGEHFADYIDPLDPVAWADAIEKYSNNTELVAARELEIKKGWKKITWAECASEVLSKLENIDRKESKRIFYDLSTAVFMSHAGASASGILRTQLILARELSRIIPDIHFFAITQGQGYVELDRTMIGGILGTLSIDQGFENCKQNLINAKGNIENTAITYEADTKEALWFILSVLPKKMQNRILSRYYKNKEITIQKRGLTFDVPFVKEDIVLTVGAGFELPVYEELLKKKEELDFKFVQLIYDFTPTLLPQVHRKETVKYYYPFLKYTYQLADLVLYGGETAKKDGEEFQKKEMLVSKPGAAIKFGSNKCLDKGRSKLKEEDVLKSLSIEGDFIIAVGSIEVRKNHETLYYAYLKMLEYAEEKGIELPQLLFVGYPGWKTQEFFNIVCRDERVRDKIYFCTPSDEVLDLLYRRCLFTVLASQYEGWSLTLPESLNYGKLCIASEVAPLMEIGKDYIEYVHPWDVKGWAEKMLFFCQNREELKKRELRIAKEWHSISWEECASQVAECLKKIEV